MRPRDVVIVRPSTCQDGSNRHDFDQKRAKKRVDHARNDQPLNRDTCVRDKVGQLLCVEFGKEAAKGNRFALGPSPTTEPRVDADACLGPGPDCPAWTYTVVRPLRDSKLKAGLTA